MRPLAASSHPLCRAHHPPQSLAACLSIVARRILSRMGTKSRETIYGASTRAAAERATEARKEADRLAIAAWNKRMLGYKGPAQPSPALGDALNAEYRYLEVRRLGCDTHQTVSLDVVRRPKATPIHANDTCAVRNARKSAATLYKRSHLVALRPTKISANEPPTTWWAWRAVSSMLSDACSDFIHSVEEAAGTLAKAVHHYAATFHLLTGPKLTLSGRRARPSKKILMTVMRPPNSCGLPHQ